MNDIKLGHKFSTKHTQKAMNRLKPFLNDGETVLLITHFMAGRKGGDTLVVTNQRVLTVWRFTSREPEFACAIEEVSRISISGESVSLILQAGDSREIGKFTHGSKDDGLLRDSLPMLFEQVVQTVSAKKKVFVAESDQVTVTAESLRPEPDGALRHPLIAATEPVAIPQSMTASDPFENLEFGPKSKEKDWSYSVESVRSFMEEGEQALGVVGENNDWYIITDSRLLNATGILKKKCAEIDTSGFIRTFVQKQTIRWWIAGADKKNNYAKIAHFSDENRALWLASKLESCLPQFKDPWRDEIRKLLREVNLTYAFENIYPIMGDQVNSERTLGGLGSGEQIFLLTSERLIILPELISMSKGQIAEIEFASGRQDRLAQNGVLVRSEMKISVEVRAVDGRRYLKQGDMGESQEQYNNLIPRITAMKRQLRDCGYQVKDGADWVDTTQSVPPQQQSTMTYIGYSFDV
jgi:hypothetical protein